MDHGTEDATLTPWDKEICHFDIKLENSKTLIAATAVSAKYS